VEAQWAAQDFASPMEWAENRTSARSTQLPLIDLQISTASLTRIASTCRCARIEEFLKAMRAKVVGFGVHLTPEEEHMSDSAIEKKHDAWIQASEYFDQEAPTTREALGAELRHLIGVVERGDAS
jgi:hypothetical protein